ncbi:LOC111597534 [Sergentomyia squamirostris]
MTEEKEPIKYNRDELNPPDFLNQDFFQKVLQNHENDKALKITKLEIIPGSKPGDHFASIMFKAIIDYTSRGKEVTGRRLVIKTMPVEEGIKRDMLKDSPIFDREIDMYTKVLPEMKRIIESIGDDEEMAAKMIYHSKEPPIIIFEDITKYGYVMHDGLFDFDNTIKIVKKLAKFHAVSFYMNDNKYAHKLDLTQYDTIMTQAMMENFKVFFAGFEYLKEVVDTWPGYEKVSEKLVDLNSKFPARLIEVYKPNPDFNILCHGDFHVKNMMFIKNGDSIEKTMFLDYQISFWGSPAIDLIYVLYAIGDDETRARRGELLSIYHASFCEYLNLLGCLKKPPSLLDLNMDLLKNGAAEILLGICFLPFMAIDFSKMDMDAIVDPTPESMAAMRRMTYADEKIVKILKVVLPELLHKGILY